MHKPGFVIQSYTGCPLILDTPQNFISMKYSIHLKYSKCQTISIENLWHLHSIVWVYRVFNTFFGGCRVLVDTLYMQQYCKEEGDIQSLRKVQLSVYTLTNRGKVCHSLIMREFNIALVINGWMNWRKPFLVSVLKRK